MTEQENVALGQLRQAINDVARQVARIERALLGDVPYGDMGLIMEHEAMMKRVADLEQAAKDQRAVVAFLKSLANLTPVGLFGLLAFASTSGIDLGFILQLLGAR